MTKNDKLVLAAREDFVQAETNGEKAACVRFLSTRLTAAAALAELITEFLDTLDIPSMHFRSSQQHASLAVRKGLREYREVSGG